MSFFFLEGGGDSWSFLSFFFLEGGGFLEFFEFFFWGGGFLEFFEFFFFLRGEAPGVF